MNSVQVQKRLQERGDWRERDMKSGTQSSAEPRSPHKEQRPLRVAFVASSYNYINDGVALTLNRLVAYLERQGVEVLVFTPVGKVPAFAHAGTVVPVPSVSLPMRPEYRLAFGLQRQAVERLRAFRPDIIHIALAPDFLGYSALKVARRLQVPVVASYHTRFETYLKHYRYAAGMTGLLRHYLRCAYGACREVYVPSQSMIDALLADGFRDNFRLWPRGVDTVHFNPGKRSSLWRAKHGIGESELIVVFVSRLVREKQLDTLAAALRLLAVDGDLPPVRVLAAGYLDPADRPYLAEIGRQMQDAGLAARFQYVGQLDRAAKIAFLQSLALFCLPTVYRESKGLSVIEAWANAVPAVLPRHGAFPEMVEDTGGGVMCEPNDPAALAAALKRMIPY